MSEPHVHDKRFDGDSPYLVCECGERWDALTGRQLWQRGASVPMTAPEPRVMPRDVLREAQVQAVVGLLAGFGRIDWRSEDPSVVSEAIVDRLAALAAVPSESDRSENTTLLPGDEPPKGYEPVIWLGSGEPISGSVAAYKALHPFGPICGMTVAGGPNGEPLACAYPQNPPDEPMHAHSWASLPTFVQGRAVPSESDAGLDAALRFINYIWTATGKDPQVHVCDLFAPDDPIVEDIERFGVAFRSRP